MCRLGQLGHFHSLLGEAERKAACLKIREDHDRSHTCFLTTQNVTQKDHGEICILKKVNILDYFLSSCPVDKTDGNWAELHTPKKMSHGSTLFSCGMMENDRWRDLSRKYPLQVEQPSANIWDCLSDKSDESSLWQREPANACSVTNLIKDLSLSDRNGNPSAPPSKRQCRSLSFSDEMSSCRASWRPIGSKVWTPVEKRRCYSGGSVQRYSNGFTTMQRSSSFSLPSRSSNSTPASTPELTRRSNGLSRSRSQPCVLNDKKVGIKRRRPEEIKEQRPSLDLVKMTQNCQTFNSLSTTVDDCPQQNQFSLGTSSNNSWVTNVNIMPGRTPACTPVPEPHSNSEEHHPNQEEDFSYEDSDFCATEDENSRKEVENSSWRESGTGGDNIFQLGGELDIEQIENN
ncbi:protein FAM53B [Crotalus adamanteus]|uniref:Protein FAM53B n=1 Tax=Crotalus adamanteus TaxID=8729 RepID=A0AAW1BG85_CROAD